MAKVKISRGLQANYNAIPVKDGDTIYVCTDTGLCYLGNILLSPTDTSANMVFLNGRTGNYQLFQYALCACDDSVSGAVWNMVPLATSGGTGSKTANYNAKFPIGCSIYYHPETDAYAANTDFSGKAFYTEYENVDARYTAINPTGLNLHNSSTSDVFLHVNVDDGYWSPYYKEGAANEIIVTSNSLTNGNFYIYLGKTSGSTIYNFQLESNHPLYYYDGYDLIDWASYIAEDSVAGSVQSITVGTTTTGEPGTNANVVNSGTPTNQILDFTIPRGADAVNPFKGWFASDTQLMTEYPNPSNGDYAYVQTSNGVLVYNASGGAWRGTTIVFNPSNNQEFASGEALNLVSIINDLVTGGASNVLSAQQGVVLNTLISNLQTLVNNLSQQMPVLEKKTAQEIKILIDTGTWTEGVMYYSVEED